MDAGCLDTGEKSQSQGYILLQQTFPEESQQALHTAESVPGTEPPFPKCVGGATPSPQLRNGRPVVPSFSFYFKPSYIRLMQFWVLVFLPRCVLDSLGRAWGVRAHGKKHMYAETQLQAFIVS